MTALSVKEKSKMHVIGELRETSLAKSLNVYRTYFFFLFGYIILIVLSRALSGCIPFLMSVEALGVMFLPELVGAGIVILLVDSQIRSREEHKAESARRLFSDKIGLAVNSWLMQLRVFFYEKQSNIDVKNRLVHNEETYTSIILEVLGNIEQSHVQEIVSYLEGLVDNAQYLNPSYMYIDEDELNRILDLTQICNLFLGTSPINNLTLVAKRNEADRKLDKEGKEPLLTDELERKGIDFFLDQIVESFVYLFLVSDYHNGQIDSVKIPKKNKTYKIPKTNERGELTGFIDFYLKEENE